MATVSDTSVSVAGLAGDKVVASQLDNAPKSLYAPIYKWRRLLQVAGGSNLTLTTGTSNSIFNIPGGGVYNFAKSFLQFDLTLTAGAANRLSTLWCDQIPINDITLQTQNGQIIANLVNVAPYTKTARFVCTNMQDYLSRESVLSNTTVANALATVNNCCQPARAANQMTPSFTSGSVLNWAATAGAGGALLAGAAGGVTAGALSQRLTTAAVTANAVTPQYIIHAGNAASAIPAAAASGPDADFISPQRISTGAANAAVIMRYKVDLNAFVGTMLAMDKNLYFGGQNLQLVINWSPLDKWGFISDTAVGNIVTLAVAANCMSNYYMYLAQEMCMENIQAAQQAVASGQQLLVPYTICPKANAAAGLFTMNTPLVAGFGILKRVLTAAVENNNTFATTSNMDNVAQVKYTTVQSFLNNSPLQDWALTCADGDDYNVLSNVLRNTPAGISGRNFRINSFWLDNFSDADAGYKFPGNDLMDSGHEVVNSENYSIQFNCAAAVQLYQYCTFVRRLVITPQNIQWA